MKKIAFLLFFLCAFLSLANQASASVVYEVTVWITSIKVPARGALMKDTSGWNFTNSEFRTSTMPYIVVKDPLGNIQSKRWFSNSGGPGIYFDAGDKTSFTFRHDGGAGKFSVYLDFDTSPCTPNVKCSAGCTEFSPTTTPPQYCMMLDYYSESSWAYANCPAPATCGRRLYIGTVRDIWFKLAEI